MKPGQSTFTVTPRFAHSRASDLLAPMRPALAAEYPTWPGTPVSPEVEEIVMMRPRRLSSISLTTGRVTW